MWNDSEAVPTFRRAGESTVASRTSIPEHESLPSTARQIIRDEISLDGNARLNLATFVTTWMEDESRELYADAFDENIVDKDEYPETAAIEARCRRMLAELWNAPDADTAIGTSTTGSSEASMLAGLALKRRWQHARRAQRGPSHPRRS
ncbi:glutamate/tyrosine decarboxylase-like PLP-dependent enzyme [Microbacterium sp. AK031]|nr:glutamate/tyrosine decarboxylase-like PLP-dependent enzyme [Microbacterium sp. AK031]